MAWWRMCVSRILDSQTFSEHTGILVRKLDSLDRVIILQSQNNHRSVVVRSSNYGGFFRGVYMARRRLHVYFAGLGCLKNVRAALCRGRHGVSSQLSQTYGF
ncbi:hypothetical protein HYC85_023013 [Camellia sinensis]|uniref:Uncharacterized protein n=1 Tax=Camellia sinensis TaxID=4442 RepID=A0A7J7GH58_CAMSI|nr:hypothetical protein HYC85_023013 [Camellia sinensis]